MREYTPEELQAVADYFGYGCTVEDVLSINAMNTLTAQFIVLKLRFRKLKEEIVNSFKTSFKK